jgi:glycosyltransferase involved in cell wall biosynthesis
MVVNNGMANDARVIKSAAAVARAGARVTALGVASAGAPRSETTVGGVRYVRLPAVPRRGVNPRFVRYALARRVAWLFPASSWPLSLPVLRLWAREFVPALRSLAPDVVHVHDVHLLDAVRRAFPDPATRPVVVYDAHEYVADLAVSGARTRRAVDAWAALERDRIGLADRIITVAPGIADRLRADHDLPETPTVVYNAPLGWPDVHASRDLRTEAGVGPGVPLAVYSGAVSPARGLDTVVRALADLPEVHLAVVAVPYPHPMASELLALAEHLGVADRLHLVPPVPSHEVPAYLAGADVAVSPIRGDSASYDMALPNKLFEFVHAGLPIATSDLREMSAFVRRHGLGAVFRQGDPASCAAAVRDALDVILDQAALQRLREEFAWQGQEERLVEVYRSLASRAPGLGALAVPSTPWRREDIALEFA